VAWLAFDDTDSRAGGCTTHLAFELVRRLDGVDLIGPPRLVRLNPAVPHKTRGNGAVSLRVGRGRGRPQVVGWDGERPLHAYPHGDEPTPASAQAIFDEARQLIDRQARLDAETTHPGLLLFGRAPPVALYEAAVSRYVGAAEAAALWRPWAIHEAAWKQGRGRLGAAAAAAWPGARVTYEWIAYRDPARWGSRRGLRPEIGPELDRHHPSTFDNHDPVHDHLRVAPASPCPILAGIRGTDPADVAAGLARLGPERPAGSLLFATNQASDDQFRPAEAARLRPFTNPALTLRVTSTPRVWKGGHVFVRGSDASGEAELAAYEPTKEFRLTVRDLRPGDLVRAYGSVQADPGLVALERLEVLSATPRRRAVAPTCATCDRRMKSRGRGEGYACSHCGRSASASVQEDAGPALRVVEVPVCVRRHLTRPLGLRQFAPALATAA
jgi:tRNA(Ile2)-agmatinylcytidine synthase